MKYLFENWRKHLLTEAMKTPADLPDNVYVGVKRARANAGKIVYYSDAQGKYIRGHKAQALGIPHGMVRFVAPVGPGRPACLYAWMVDLSEAAPGWGPLLYDVAIELAGKDGLMADRDSLSDEAYDVWRYYQDNRSDVRKKQLDDVDDTLTPDAEDNCETDTAFRTYPFSSHELSAEELIDSPIMKVYTKGPTTIETLRSMGKLIEYPGEDESIKITVENKRRMLEEVTLRLQKDKKLLYHIGPRPAEPKPTTPETYVWGRPHRVMPDTGVFMSPNYIDISKFHGISGNVYAYSVPHWVIKKNKGTHRFDLGTEIYISGETWEEAGDEIEFLGKKMSEDELRAETEYSGWLPTRRKDSTKKPGWFSDEEWERYSDKRLKKYYLDGLRSTQHLKDVIKMLSADERKEAVRVFSNIEYGPYEGTKTNKLRDRDILRTLKSTSGEYD